MIKVLILVMPTGKRWHGWVKNGRVIFTDGDFEDLSNPNLVDPTSDEIHHIIQYHLKVAKRKDNILLIIPLGLVVKNQDSIFFYLFVIQTKIHI